MANAVTRRSVLAVIGMGLGTALAACESDSGPTVSTATPGPTQAEEPLETSDTAPPASTTAADAAALVLALERAASLADRCQQISGAARWHLSVQGRVQGVLDEQVRVLTDVLEAGEVGLPSPAPTSGDGVTSTGDATGSTAAPDDGADSTATPGDSAGSTDTPGDGDAATATATPAERAAAALRALGKDCLADVAPEALTALAEVSEVNLPMLLSIAAQRGATAQLLGQQPQWEELAGPTGAAAASLLDVYRPAVYGFEVLAARSSGDERTSYETVLTPLRAVTRQITQLAGDSASPAPLGYGLPQGTGAEAGRSRLAGELLAVLPPTIMGQTQTFAGDPASVAGSVRLLAEAVHLGRAWNPMSSFPGMQVSGA